MAVVVTQCRAKKADKEAIDRMLPGLEAISDEQAESMLANQR